MDKLRLDKPLVSHRVPVDLLNIKQPLDTKQGGRHHLHNAFCNPALIPCIFATLSSILSTRRLQNYTHFTTFSVIPDPLSVFKLVCISRSEALTSQGSLQSSTPSTAPNSGQMPLSSRQGTQTSQSCTLQSPTLSLLLYSYFSTQLTTGDQTSQSCTLQSPTLPLLLHSYLSTQLTTGDKPKARS